MDASRWHFMKIFDGVWWCRGGRSTWLVLERCGLNATGADVQHIEMVMGIAAVFAMRVGTPGT